MDIRIRSTEDAVPVIAALATKAIAHGGHEGHDLETVGERMTRTEILDRIRAGYERRITRGDSPKEAVIAVGVVLVATYCDRAGIPTTR
ncbi:hypothetical protein [Streptomyces albidoflavus]|uniref:hypothetical protein n=1 Tax=Streptomyces albidoflavus TaxID=1886 RepID=UPI002F90D225|nr:hypothetical protein OHA76_00700 [Streptomyces albidoflavus]WSD56994.1 hypothetical protein OHA76_31500 [Streptomyces albidoflavus]WTE00975.1 hypothetical protein OG950_31470 [Streptomyces albidoflavus]